MKNNMEEYCISYSIKTYHETPWFKAKSRKEAIKLTRAIIGADIKIETTIGRKDFYAKERISKKL